MELLEWIVALLEWIVDEIKEIMVAQALLDSLMSNYIQHTPIVTDE